MKKDAVKDLLYGGLLELINNRNNYYNSGIGSSYSHFTDQGNQAIQEYLKEMATMMLVAEEESLDKRAKALVMKGLKGE
jgi:hypothetical protein